MIKKTHLENNLLPKLINDYMNFSATYINNLIKPIPEKICLTQSNSF